MLELQRYQATLATIAPDAVWSEFRGAQRVCVDAAALHSSLQHLSADGMDMLVDITCVDLLEYPEAADRYRLVYQLLSTESGDRLEVRAHLNDPDPHTRSVTDIWASANWLEREVYDMYGIHFDGHPDHRRLLLPDAFESFPLRKDYPLKGRGERHNFTVITRSES